MSDAHRYRLDDLRRLAAALGSAVGLAPARASAVALQLLWFDAVGALSFGIGTLPDWLERIASGSIDPLAEGKVTTERTGTAVLDGQNGIAPLVLARAGGIAVEKARDAGVGLVRVTNLGPCGPATSVAAEMAVGPMIGLVLGPGPSWTVALPSEEGLPSVHDSSLGDAEPLALGRLAPLVAVLAPESGWLVAAIAVVALEPLTTFQNRVSSALEASAPGTSPGSLSPQDWETRRREAREQGVPLGPDTWAKLKLWAERYGVALPEPMHASH